MLTGQPSVFVRASGCNLRCWFCDTPYASWKPEGEDLAPEEIVDRVVESGLSHVVITGGEPMLFGELIPLCKRLRDLKRHITIETAGTLFLPLACDLMSISPKLASSAPLASQQIAPAWRRRHERDRQRPGVVRQLMDEYEHQLKFVIDAPGDVDEVDAYLAELGACDRRRVLLMPQGVTPEELVERAVWLEPMCAELGLAYCPRKHIEWYGHRRGT